MRIINLEGKAPNCARKIVTLRGCLIRFLPLAVRKRHLPPTTLTASFLIDAAVVVNCFRHFFFLPNFKKGPPESSRSFRGRGMNRVSRGLNSGFGRLGSTKRSMKIETEKFLCFFASTVYLYRVWMQGGLKPAIEPACTYTRTRRFLCVAYFGTNVEQAFRAFVKQSIIRPGLLNVPRARRFLCVVPGG